MFRVFDLILVQSKGFVDSILSYRGVRKEKVEYLPNSYEVTAPVEADELPDWVEEFRECFSVVFAGNIGKAQNLPLFLDGAERLKEFENIRLFFVGEGSERQKLMSEAASRGIGNVAFPGRVAREKIDAILSEADVLILSLSDMEGVAETIPSKLQGYLAAGKPVVLAGGGESEKIIAAAGCGFTCPATDAEKFADSIKRLFAMSVEERNRIGEQGRIYFQSEFSGEKQNESLRSFFLEVLSSRS